MRSLPVSLLITRLDSHYEGLKISDIMTFNKACSKFKVVPNPEHILTGAFCMISIDRSLAFLCCVPPVFLFGAELRTGPGVIWVGPVTIRHSPEAALSTREGAGCSSEDSWVCVCVMLV
eukprot:2016918-Amphidinium_carterae.3